MSRCVCCDYSPLTDSEFYSSIKVRGSEKTMFLDRKTGDYYCDDCRKEIKEIINENWFNDNEEKNGFTQDLHFLFDTATVYGLDTTQVKEEDND